MAKLPRAVQAAAKRANDILEEANKPKEEAQATPEVVEPVAINPEAPANTEAEKPKESVAPTAEDKGGDPDYWERRFKSSEGIFKAEKQKLSDQLDALRAQVGELTAKLSEVKKSEPTKLDIFTDEDRRTFDEDTLQLLERSILKAAQTIKNEAREEATESIKPLQTELEEAKRDLQKRNENAFWRRLEEAVPDFREVNDDLRFHNWLAQVDDFTDIQRQEILAAAQARLDAEKVAKVFNAFKAEAGLGKKPSEVKPTLEDKVTPDPAAASQSLSAPEAVTSGDIKRHYDRKVRDSRYKVSKECEEMERKINRAIQAGRLLT